MTAETWDPAVGNYRPPRPHDLIDQADFLVDVLFAMFASERYGSDNKERLERLYGRAARRWRRRVNAANAQQEG